MKILENVAISTLTTMRLGGPARFVVEVETVDDIKPAFDFIQEQHLPVYILGGGANSLGLDEGYAGIILINKMKGIKTLEQDDASILIKGMGGEIWDDVVAFTTEQNYSGIEALSSIPGTLGAAPVQNIGAYGQEVGQVLESADVLDLKTGEVKTITKQEMDFAYRHSIFNHGESVGRFFIIAVTLRLKKGQLEPPFYTSLQAFVDENQITDFSPKNIRAMVAKIRAAKLPDPKIEASSGSFFKNVYLSDAEAEVARTKGVPVRSKPGENKVNTGWLIEEAGLKGQSFYGMRVSDKASLVLINDSAKSYHDLAMARDHIKDVVREKFGYEIEQEPVEIK